MTVISAPTAPRVLDPRPLLFPRSVAVVGPTPRRPEVVENACAGSARVWGVHPVRRQVLGLECVPSAAELSETPDAAWLLVGHERVERALEDMLDIGVRAFVVPGLGTEAGPGGRLVAERITGRAAESGAVLLGPNCMGVAVPDGTSSWIGTVPATFASGHVAAIVQSGSVGEAMLALGPRVGFRAVVSTGAEAVVGAADCLAWFARDDRTRAIALFLETVRQPAAFVDALERCSAAGKPVVCLKVGRSDAAARAALAHTGAIVGSASVFSAVLKRCGAIEVDDVPELVEVMEVLGRRRRPAGLRLGVISESGGEGALLADHADAVGLNLPPLEEEVASALKAEFSNLLEPSNPLDAWAVGDPEIVYPRCLEVLARSEQFDILVAQLDLSRFRGEAEQQWGRVVVQALAEVCRNWGIFAAVTTVHTSDPPAWAQGLANDADMPLLRGVGNAARALAKVAGWRPTLPDPFEADSTLGGPISGDGALSEHDSAALLERYGVRFAPHIVASTPEEAAAAVLSLGPPVVVKVDGPAHKTRVGGVVLGVTDPEHAAEVARMLGGRVLVAKQVERGIEAFCGMTRDEQFGPVIAIGHGGTDVEDLRSAAIALAPVSFERACALVDEVGLTRARNALARAVVALSHLSLTQPDIVEVDVNPLILSESDAIAVDALIVIKRGAPHA